jgi:hypothetical protein
VLQRALKVTRSTAKPEAPLVMTRRSSLGAAAFVVRNKAAQLLGLRKGPKAVPVIKYLVFTLMGLSEFAVPQGARLRIKLRILTSKLAVVVPYWNDLRRFPTQTVSLTVYDAKNDVVHVFVVHRDKHR